VASQAPAPSPAQASAPPPDAPRPAQALAPGDTPVPISRPAPSYPPDAIRNGETGTAVVRIEVGADGEPVEVSLVTRTGSRSLDRAALAAARRWKFRPAQRNGQPVPGVVEAPIAFSLER
jgi:protein TonB